MIGPWVISGTLDVKSAVCALGCWGREKLGRGSEIPPPKKKAGAHNRERATPLRSCHSVFTDQFSFRFWRKFWLSLNSNFVVSCLNKHVKKLVIHGEQEFSFSTLSAPFNFPNLFLLFLLISKCFQKFQKCFLAALLSDMKCLLQHNSGFVFLQWKVSSKCSQSAGCHLAAIFNRVNQKLISVCGAGKVLECFPKVGTDHIENVIPVCLFL